jgi:ketosteroid isomerase-like protein
VALNTLMRLIPLVQVFLAFFVPYVQPVLAQSYATECQRTEPARAVCAMDAALTDALRRNDAAQLAVLYADDFRLVNYRGREVDKAGVLAVIRIGTLRFDSLTTSELRLRLSESVALISGRQHHVAREPGPDDQAHSKDVRFLNVYVRRDGRWSLVATQITPILAAAPR